MMHLKLETDPQPAGHAGAKIMTGTHPEFSAPKPEIAPSSQLLSPTFSLLPRLACDVVGCKKYGQAFKSEQALLEHRRAVHRRSAEHRSAPPATPPPASPEPAAVAASQEKKFKCKECGETFDILYQLGKHVHINHPRNAEQRAAARAARAPKNTYPDNKCPHCRKQFQNWRGLSSHLRWQVCQQPAPAPQRAAGVPPTVPKTEPPKTKTHFIGFTGSKTDVAAAALLLIEHGFNNLTTGEL